MAYSLTLPLLPNERWWGGHTNVAAEAPYGAKPFSATLLGDTRGNQANPVLISSRGRYIWCDEPFRYSFTGESLVVEEAPAPIISSTTPGGSLRSALCTAAKQHFPSSGSIPDPLFFTAPQYNLWIECLYEPTQERVVNFAREALAHGFPPGVIMIDTLWHEPQYGNWQFHSGRFPDPRGMFRELHQMGFKTMVWAVPFITPDSMVFRQLRDRGLLLNDASGQTAIRRWWDGYSAVLDTTNPAAVQWLADACGHLQSMGVDGFKFDAGDAIYYRADDKAHTPMSPNAHSEEWGRFGLRYSLNEYRACWKLAGQALVQRLCDRDHSWQQLTTLIPDGLAQGLCGYAYTCPDMIGGGQYTSFLAAGFKLDQELFARWAQCSALFPMMQFSLAPWRVLDGEHLALCRAAAEMHGRYAKRILDLAHHSSRTGEPILRHMEYVFPNQGFAEVRDQFLVGDDVLVAPVVTKGAREREVVFPAGTWESADGVRVDGPCTKRVAAPLDVLPVFERIKE